MVVVDAKVDLALSPQVPPSDLARGGLTTGGRGWVGTRVIGGGGVGREWLGMVATGARCGGRSLKDADAFRACARGGATVGAAAGGAVGFGTPHEPPTRAAGLGAAEVGFRGPVGMGLLLNVAGGGATGWAMGGMSLTREGGSLTMIKGGDSMGDGAGMEMRFWISGRCGA